MPEGKIVAEDLQSCHDHFMCPAVRKNRAIGGKQKQFAKRNQRFQSPLVFLQFFLGGIVEQFGILIAAQSSDKTAPILRVIGKFGQDAIFGALQKSWCGGQW